MKRPDAESVWKWLATILGGIVIAGASSSITAKAQGDRIKLLEDRATRIEERLVASEQRSAIERLDTRERLSRIEGDLDKIVAWIMGSSHQGLPK